MDGGGGWAEVVKARAAGFVEGNLQGAHMYRYWTNYRSNQYRGFGERPSPALLDFLEAQNDWMMRRVQQYTGWDLAAVRGAAGQAAWAERARAQAQHMGSGAAAAVAAAAAVGGHRMEHLVALRGHPHQGEAAGAGEEKEEVEGEGGSRRLQQQGQQQQRAQGQQEDSDRRYWTLVGLVAAQFEGLAAGFWASVVDPGRNMTWGELYALNALGDLYELNVLFPPAAPGAEAAGAGGLGRPPRRYSPGHGEVGPYGYGELLDCSALIKITEADYEDDVSDGGEEGEDVEGEEDAGEQAEEELGGADEHGRQGRRLRATLLGRRGGTAELRAQAAPEHVSRRRRARGFLAAHNTWRSYFEMVRTWKVYDLPWASSGPLTVSSSPGLLHSKDDWYTTDQFVVMETTNGIYNKTLYDLISHRSVLMWQRVQVANYGARSGPEWVELFERHNSGTYNNQWMVLDVPRLTSGHTRDILWVLEQVPGTVVSKDASEVLLEQGYWASYNVPYFPEIYDITAYPKPSIYETCPRAQIFKREQSRVAGREDLMALMRLNRYQSDAVSLGMPNNAIAARYDLPAVQDADGVMHNWTRRAYGAVDAKVVDADSFAARRTFVVNGPTDTDQQPFVWSSEPLWDVVRHEGTVDAFNFGWQAYANVVSPQPDGASARRRRQRRSAERR
ncbi:hypothetical protein HYH03_002574 [Edaphochlamys debaryana]|uniref:Phospholipase B-like n=1 Tax=Edaphochlamys debaryana TaxID=47281 RepID=A0A835YAZ6_9CHLO|nr:hypothetical protein HYH03_002574 [Edaphochlamys debaryana]|eukprot:KAG2499635.1 hypothetical protein HYH03_002574 [Edaphochlamys debaryana]